MTTAIGDHVSHLAPGWYVQLSGEKYDLEDWVYSFNEPFDPTVFEYADGAIYLSSDEFSGLSDASEVREKALALVARLNGTMALMHSAGPVQSGGVIRVDENGKRHTTLFAECAIFGVRARMRATATVTGPDGKLIPPPAPQPSPAQNWNALASSDYDVADLLEQLGRADSWYEIYKTIELAEILCGGEHRLAKLLGSSKDACKNMRSTANFYRHARTHRPDILTTLEEAKSLLHLMVRSALDSRMALPPTTAA